MKVLILSQYFPPETGAPQNRLYSLAHNLVKHGCDVKVLTAMPNYPEMKIFPKYRGRFYINEQDGHLNINRSWIFANRSIRIISRMLNYFSFMFSSFFIGLLKIKKHDVIICESPPIFLGITAIALAKIINAKLIFNVSDLWPESVEKLGIIKNKFILNLTYKLEGLIYKNSSLVSGQTQGILKSIKDRYPKTKTFWLRNGIDFEQFNTKPNAFSFRTTMNLRKEDFVLVYAGIIGHAQGLETLIIAAKEIRSQVNIKFFIVGDGPEKSKLIQLARNADLKNIFFLSNRPRNQIPDIIAACNAYIVPLKKNDLFKGAIPSKLFEPLAMGKPILLGVDGEARDIFIEKGKCGLYFEPENPVDLNRCITTLYNNRTLLKELGQNGKKYVSTYFNRSTIAKEFFNELKLLFD